MADGKHKNMDATLRAAARRNAKIIRLEPDCRTCAHYCPPYLAGDVCAQDPCTNADRYEPLPPVRLWRTT